jgi:hypothetical protein
VPERDIDIAGRCIALTGYAASRANSEAVMIFFGNEVHDARDRIRAVYRRGAAGDYFDAFDQELRNIVDVDGIIDAGRCDTPPVEHYQRPAGPESPQIDVGGKLHEIRGASGYRQHLWHPVQRFDDRRLPGDKDVVLVKCRQGARRHEVTALDAGSGNDDLFDGDLAGRFIDRVAGGLRISMGKGNRAGRGHCNRQQHMTTRCSIHGHPDTSPVADGD